MRRLTLTNRLLLLITAALLPVTLVLFWNLHVLRKAEEREAHENVLRTGQLFSLEMQRIITGLQNLLIAVSAAPSVLEDDSTKCTALLARLSQRHPAISSLSVAMPDGRVRCGQEARGAGISLADRPYFQSALKTDDLVVGEYTKGRVTGNAVLPLALAMRNSAGKVLGAAVLAVNLFWLEKQVEERDLPKGAALTVADRDGITLARYPQPEKFVGTKIPDAYMHLVNAAESGTTELTSQDGTRRILAYFPTSVPPHGLYVSTGISTDEQYSALRSATLTGLVATVSALLLSLLLYWHTSRRAISAPMNRILGTIAAWREAHGGVRSRMSRHEGESGTIGATIDELEQSQEQQRLLAGELGHRMKNMLTLVNLMANRTFLKGAVTDTAKAAFQQRLLAISNAYDVLAHGEWKSASLAEVVTAALRPFAADADPQIEMRGDEILVDSSAALAFDMALHELATNAAKYGGLSAPEGRVAVEWRINHQSREVFFTWLESGGPEVTPPGAAGFGSMLLKRALAGQLGASVDIDFSTDGLSCRIDAPLERITPRPS